jgi:hypothetical protein
MFQFPVKRGSREEILQAVKDLEGKGFRQVSDIVQVVHDKRVEFADEYKYSKFIVKMEGDSK